MTPLFQGAGPLSAHPFLPWAHTMVRLANRMATMTPMSLGDRAQVEAPLPPAFRAGYPWPTTACPCPNTATSVAVSSLSPSASSAACVGRKDYNRPGAACIWNCMAPHTMEMHACSSIPYAPFTAQLVEHSHHCTSVPASCTVACELIERCYCCVVFVHLNLYDVEYGPQRRLSRYSHQCNHAWKCMRTHSLLAVGLPVNPLGVA